MKGKSKGTPWYKTHIPKSMRNGLTNLQIMNLRERIYKYGKRYV